LTRFSIIIPTHQRRDVVARNVTMLQRQLNPDFEVIVVDDGSSDGTAEALRRLEVSFPLTVIEQENRGAGAARNAGAAVAVGDYLLFLDDDMEADPRMLDEHVRSHADGGEVVLGDLPLHVCSPRNVLSWAVGRWTTTRRERLSAPGAQVPLGDLLTGQLSISRANYRSIGGFDASFTREGLFGGEDTDFGYRVLSADLRIVFNPQAISYQYYDVDPAEFLKRAYEAGRSSHELLLKYPDQADRFGRVREFDRRRDRWLLGPLVLAPAAVSWPLRAGVVSLARSGHTGGRLRRLLFLVRTMERLRGLRAARRASSTGKAIVLAYHAIADQRGDPITDRYSVPPLRFNQHLDWLASKGWTFVDANALLEALAGERLLPRRSVLVTFDDGYADFPHAALPALRKRLIPSVVFVVAGQIGASNKWDQVIGGGPMELMDADALHRIAAGGVEIGSHGLWHRSVAALDSSELLTEVQESAARLERLGLPRPRLYSYPYGESTVEAGAVIRGAGYAAAFTVSPGVVTRGSDLYSLPRVQVHPGDSARVLGFKLATAGWPLARRDRLLRLIGANG
jgi:glycosyltransferase involved in cell wall biosynthesis/peptidoglycan/xylan/chitin deacetylase (PgdA/CDA1 family)